MNLNLTEKKETKELTIDRVYNENDDNEIIFNEECKYILDNVLNGGIGNILAYGQTGSGKT